MTCYQACKSFEIFTICLAFLLIQKVDVAAITVKSTSRELDWKSYLNCPGKFSFYWFDQNSNKKFELQTNMVNLKQIVLPTVKISDFVVNVVKKNTNKRTKNVITVHVNNKQQSCKLLYKSSYFYKLLGGLHPGIPSGGSRPEGEKGTGRGRS